MIGYSFGAYAAVCAISGVSGVSGVSGALDDLSALVLISPTVNQHDFTGLLGRPIPKLVIYSDNDFATPASATRQWFNTLPDPKRQLCLSGGQHFYRLREQDVSQACAQFLQANSESAIDETP